MKITHNLKLKKVKINTRLESQLQADDSEMLNFIPEDGGVTFVYHTTDRNGNHWTKHTKVIKREHI